MTKNNKYSIFSIFTLFFALFLTLYIQNKYVPLFLEEQTPAAWTPYDSLACNLYIKYPKEWQPRAKQFQDKTSIENNEDCLYITNNKAFVEIIRIKKETVYKDSLINNPSDYIKAFKLESTREKEGVGIYYINKTENIEGIIKSKNEHIYNIRWSNQASLVDKKIQEHIVNSIVFKK